MIKEEQKNYSEDFFMTDNILYITPDWLWQAFSEVQRRIAARQVVYLLYFYLFVVFLIALSSRCSSS